MGSEEELKAFKDVMGKHLPEMCQFPVMLDHYLKHNVEEEGQRIEHAILSLLLHSRQPVRGFIADLKILAEELEERFSGE